MTWNGTVINNVPTLIYHDELMNGTIYFNDTDHNGPGTLVCTSTALRTIFWSYPTDASAIQPFNFTQNFHHLPFGSKSDPPIRGRLQRNPINPITAPIADERANGLWRCHERHGLTLHVGIFARRT